MNIYKLNKEAKKRARNMRKLGITKARNSSIAKVLEGQEIVSYCSSKGCRSFDHTDLELV